MSHSFSNTPEGDELQHSNGEQRVTGGPHPPPLRSGVSGAHPQRRVRDLCSGPGPIAGSEHGDLHWLFGRGWDKMGWDKIGWDGMG